jgi:hypothetical protein
LVRAPAHLNAIRGASIAWLAMERLGQALAEDISTCTPLYIRPSEAELARTNR